jgi:hypothetical protein
MKEYFNNYLKGDRVEGKGEVYDVVLQRGFSVNSKDCIIIIRCKNDVFAYVLCPRITDPANPAII